MSKQWIRMAALATVFAICQPMRSVAQSSAAEHDTYTWSGELVSLDTAAKTMTVKSRVAYPDAVGALKQFKAADRVLVVWSGVGNRSDAVREVRRFEPSRRIDESLALPAELVSTDAPHDYITIRVKLPANAVSGIAAVKPGEWVTVTSRPRPSRDDDAVVAVRPYVARTTD